MHTITFISPSGARLSLFWQIKATAERLFQEVTDDDKDIEISDEFGNNARIKRADVFSICLTDMMGEFEQQLEIQLLQDKAQQRLNQKRATRAGIETAQPKIVMPPAGAA